MAVKGWIEVNPLFCKGCELCVAACPQEVLALDMVHITPKGFHPVALVKGRLHGLCNMRCRLSGFSADSLSRGACKNLSGTSGCLKKSNEAGW